MNAIDKQRHVEAMMRDVARVLAQEARRRANALRKRLKAERWCGPLPTLELVEHKRSDRRIKHGGIRVEVSGPMPPIEARELHCDLTAEEWREVEAWNARRPGASQFWPWVKPDGRDKPEEDEWPIAA